MTEGSHEVTILLEDDSVLTIVTNEPLPFFTTQKFLHATLESKYAYYERVRKMGICSCGKDTV